MTRRRAPLAASPQQPPLTPSPHASQAPKIERAVHHVRSLSDAHSDAPTVRSTNTPPRSL